MTNQPNETPEEKELHSGKYEGKFAAKKGKKESVASEDKKEKKSKKDKREKKEKKHRLPLGVRILLIILIVLLALVVIAVVTFLILRSIGKRKSVIVQPDTVISIADGSSDKTVIVQKDDKGRVIEYDGHTYELNENLTAILFVGVDAEFSDASTTYGSAGQADVIMLVVMDTVTGHTEILGFPRDAYAEVGVYSADGRYLRTEFTQLCHAFAYGDQHELSCKNTVESVERFLYGIQIPSYIALDMDGILVANDSIGGVTLTSLDDIDLSRWHHVKAGEKITLLGDEADSYIRSRSHEDMEANKARMARQSQYVREFVATVVGNAKGDPMSLVGLYQTLGDYMVTNIGLDTATYLAPVALQGGMSFSDDNLHTIKSTVEMVEGYPMYYLDEDDLRVSIINTFYTQID